MKNSKFNKLFKMIMEDVSINTPYIQAKNLLYGKDQYGKSTVWILSDTAMNPFFRKSEDHGDILILKNLYNIAAQIYCNRQQGDYEICPGCVIQLWYAVQDNDVELITEILGHGLTDSGLCDISSNYVRKQSRIPGLAAKGYLDRTFCTQMWNDTLKQVKNYDYRLDKKLTDMSLFGKDINIEKLQTYQAICRKTRAAAIAIYKANIANNITDDPILEERFDSIGRTAFSSREISADNQSMPALNPSTGEQILDIVN